MPWCVVIGCKNNLKATKLIGKHISYHIFPKNPQRRSAWINSLNRPFKLNADSSYICSDHFIPDDFECYSLKEELLNIKVKRQLKKTAIPSINMPKSPEEHLETTVNCLNSQSSNEINNFNKKFKNINRLDMQQHCAVPNCNSTVYNTSNEPKGSKNMEFHKFPNDVEIFDKWLEFCEGSKELSPEYQNAKICSDHFNKDSYEYKYSSEMKLPIKQLKRDAVPLLKNDTTIIDEEVVIRERKKLVDKLLADYEVQQKKNEGHLKGIQTNHPNFFAPKINPNAKLGDKLRLIKSINNPEMYSPPKKRKISSSKYNSESSELPGCNNFSQYKDQVIQVSAVKGGLMLHALPQTTSNISTYSEKNVTDEEEEIIIVTEDEASFADISSYETHHKENNTEVIIVTNLRETEETLKHVESLPKLSKIDGNDKCHVQNQLENNESSSTPLCTTKVSLSEEKGCQVLIPCKGCEHRSLKINKLLRERTRLLKDLNQNGTWKDPDEINTLRKMNGVLSLLLLQCIGDKCGKKSSSIRVDLVKDSIERIDQGWTMQDTSEALSQVLSNNAYDELARKFEIINEI